ncbi:hypothetical protein T459_11542 [Capsicum annuum]|uniref:Peptidase A1 domain-containing protein n=1 Tax=Capsicum annuum TaxID=4072 RepID=A0A2G2ZM88_CAPAN|nr:hypothetical protein T459_11542 [Capsicum annuum]
MCFGVEGLGRVDFGDKGSLDQGETPFNLEQPHQTYNISMTGITVGNKNTDVDFTAIFDSGTSFTYLNDPAYEVITENDGSTSYCLAVVKSGDVNIIGREYLASLRTPSTGYLLLPTSIGYDSKESKSKTILPVKSKSLLKCLFLPVYWQKRPEKMEMGSLGVTGNVAVSHRFEPFTQPLAKIQSKAAQSKPLQSGPSLDPEHSWSLVHQAALF